MLTARGFQITNKLLNTTEPVRIRDLSMEYGVSTRTIKYDLENVKDWFREQGHHVNSSTSKGLWVECDHEERVEIRRILTQFERAKIFPDQSVRVKRIVLSFLLSNEFITAGELSELMQVSRNTILSDLNHVEKFVENWMIQLERKQRVGYRLAGSELQLRLLLEFIIYSDLDDYEVYKMTTRITKSELVEELPPIFAENLEKVYKLVESNLSYLFSQSLPKLLRFSYLLKFQLRVTFSVTRLIMGHTINSYRVLDRSRYTDDVSLFLLGVMDQVYAQMQLPLLEEEFEYILGSIEGETEQIDVIEVTEKMIEFVSMQENIDYTKDPKLTSNLFAHLSLRFQGGTLYLKEMNPIEEEIKRNHTKLFKSVQDACRRFIRNHTFSTQDSFISFIVLHFLVSYENSFKRAGRVKILYVCSTGRGVARLIKNKVEREIPAVDIIAYCSLLEVEEVCQQEEVDLIVSVFPVETAIPVIVVDPFPTKVDIEIIREQVKVLIGPEAEAVSLLLENSELHPNQDFSESISQEIILKGFEVTHALLEAFPSSNASLQENWKDAFAIHVFLMVHRYYFDKQYDQYLYTNNQLQDNDFQSMTKVRNILKEKELHVHEAEVTTLLQYLEKGKRQQE